MVSSQFWEFSLRMTCCPLSFGSWFPCMALSCLFLMFGWVWISWLFAIPEGVQLDWPWSLRAMKPPSSPRLAFVEGISSTCTVSQWIHGGEDGLCSFESVCFRFAVTCCAGTRLSCLGVRVFRRGCQVSWFLHWLFVLMRPCLTLPSEWPQWSKAARKLWVWRRRVTPSDVDYTMSALFSKTKSWFVSRWVRSNSCFLNSSFQEFS